MKPIPETEHPLVLRTDFSSETVWKAIVAEIQKPVGLFRFRAYVEFLDDPEYSGITKEQLLALMPKDYNQAFIMLVDAMTVAQEEHPLLIVDLYEGTGNEFRAVPAAVQSIENNLSIANMDFEEFATAVDPDGIFRDFPE